MKQPTYAHPRTAAGVLAAFLAVALGIVCPAVAQTDYFDNVLNAAFRDGAAGDYDNDGRTDFYVHLMDPARVGLLHNEGFGRFRTIRLGRPDKPIRAGGVFGDYDADGDLDLFAPSGNVEMPRYDVLLHNDRASFVDVALAAGLTDSLPSTGAVWLDYDRDGHLDLYIAHAVSIKEKAVRPELRNRLHRNAGDGTFADVTARTGLDVQLHPEWGGSFWGMAANDFDGDGWPDLYVSVRRDRNRLFLSDGQGAFLDATTSELGGVPEENSLGVAVGDIDNDGDLDLFQAVASDEIRLDADTPISLLAPDLTNPQRSRMLLNLGGAEFLDVTDGVGLSVDRDLWEAAFADIDSDGDLDLLGLPLYSSLYVNQGEGTFADSSGRAPLAAVYLSFADYDRDGFLDYLTGGASTVGSGTLARNTRLDADNHWLAVELVGTSSNRSGVGARVVASTATANQTREFRAGLGQGQDEMVAHFGLGSQLQVERLAVHWPSGQLDELTDIPADQRIRVIEGRGTYHPVAPTVWITQLPAALIAGTTTAIDAAIRPALFEGQARIDRVTADLSALGGPDSLPLQETGDGTYRLELELAPLEPGTKELSVWIEQATAVGPRWSRLVESVVVFPGGDVIVWDGEAGNWQVESRGRVENLDLSQGAVVYRGDVAASIQVKKTFSPWKVSFRADRPVPRHGFRGLRFAFHPGDVVLEAGASLSVAAEPGKAASLLDLVDAERREWQSVEVPLPVTAHDEPIEALSFAGTFGGTFYLDAIELVATALPEADLPVFADGLHDGWTVRPEWFLNLSRHRAGDHFPAWSPDGQRVAFYSFRDGTVETYVVDAAGGDPVNVTNSPGHNGMAAWSPDGTRIAFSSYRDGNNEIYVMSADGSDPVNLTKHPGTDFSSSWSPDGQKIAFYSARDENDEIYVMDADGANPVRLTDHPKPDRVPVWSPDGTRIAFHSRRDGNWEIHVMSADGSGPVNLTNHTAEDDYASWSPDGSRIAFESDRDGNEEIYVMNADGSDPVNLTNHLSEDHHPSWSPDGSHIAFATDREGNDEVYVMEVGPSRRVSVTPTSTTALEDLASLQVRCDEAGQWRVTCQPPSPLDVTGYHSLHLAFHPGDTVSPERASLRVSTNGEGINLLGGVLEGRQIDLEVRDWQVVELPLDVFGLEGKIETIAFSGNLVGTCYLADIRLVKATPTITAIVEERASGLPEAFALEQNYPNPFNPATTIRFALPARADVDLSLYSVLGQRVASLVSGTREAGTYTLRWDGRDEDERDLASGVYLYRLRAGRDVATRKLLLVR